MTRGTIVLVTPNNEVWKTLEFNGEMYIEDGSVGAEVLAKLPQIGTVKELKEFAISINDKHYHYSLDEEPIIYPSSLDKLCNLKENYLDNWFSDYLFIRNCSNKIIDIECANGELQLKPNCVTALYFANIIYNLADLIDNLKQSN